MAAQALSPQAITVVNQIAPKLPQNNPLIQLHALRHSLAYRSIGDGDRMLRLLRNPIGLVAVASLAAAVGACSTNQLAEIGSVNLIPRVDNLARPDWLTYSGAKDEFSLRAVTAADLVTQEGQCPSAENAPAPEQLGPDGAPVPAGGIALQMTECDVVRRAGAPDQVQIGGDETGQRAVIITYTRGSRPGVYRFASGRLQSIERAPGTAAPPTPKQKGKARQKRAT